MPEKYNDLLTRSKLAPYLQQGADVTRQLCVDLFGTAFKESAAPQESSNGSSNQFSSPPVSPTSTFVESEGMSPPGEEAGQNAQTPVSQAPLVSQEGVTTQSSSPEKPSQTTTSKEVAAPSSQPSGVGGTPNGGEGVVHEPEND